MRVFRLTISGYYGPVISDSDFESETRGAGCRASREHSRKLQAPSLEKKLGQIGFRGLCAVKARPCRGRVEPASSEKA